MDIIYLSIQSFIGLAPGAMHYNGLLRRKGGDEVWLSKVMTAKDAVHFNKADGFGSAWKKGMKTERFLTEGTVIDLAIETYQDHFPNAGLLIKGDPAYAEPMPILDGPDDVRAKASTLIKRSEKNNWWDGDDKTMLTICDEWDALLEDLQGR